MTETVVRRNSEPEIDEELLAEAQRHIGVGSRNEAINAALLELVEERRSRRREARDELRRMSAEGRFNYAPLDEDDD